MKTTNDDIEKTGGGGNTSTPPSYRKWCFTLNNYTKKEFNDIKTYLSKGNKLWIVGEEIGEEGTPHLQGYIEAKSVIKFTTLKNLNNRLHLEKAKGDKWDNWNYCSKEGKYECNYEPIKKKLLKKYEKIEWKEWQQQILNIIKEEPDERIINVVVDEIGNKGKSFLCKYIYLTNECIIADGKKDNIFNQIKTKLDEEKEFKIILLDIPRHNKDYINYGCIEQIKNGLIYSGKYEGGDCLFDNVHVIIFSNEDLDYSKMSRDRWNVIRI